jgi:hypothetical protein
VATIRTAQERRKQRDRYRKANEKKRIQKKKFLKL